MESDFGIKVDPSIDEESQGPSKILFKSKQYNKKMKSSTPISNKSNRTNNHNNILSQLNRTAKYLENN